MIKTATQLKAKIRNISGGDNKIAMIMIRTFFMERFLERISLSQYQNQFILKGGMLVSSLIGINDRSTMDIDTTVNSMPVTIEAIRRSVTEICEISVDDRVSFEIIKIEKIMEDFDYPGIRIHLNGLLDKLKQPIKVDISTDDVITPSSISYNYQLLFEKRTIVLRSYNIESLLAEKVQTIIFRGLANTRMRDFYDVYEVSTNNTFSQDVFGKAFMATCIKRDTVFSPEQIQKVLDLLVNSPDIRNMWIRFANQNYYVKEVRFEWTIDVIRNLLVV